MSTKRTNVLVVIDSTPDSEDPLVLSLLQPTRIVRGSPLPEGIAATRLMASGGTGGYVYDITEDSNSGLPPGLTLNSVTGKITGTPTIVGHYSFNAEVQDSSATAAVGNFSIEVFTTLIFNDQYPVDGEVGVDYSFRFSLTGETGAISWSINSGSTPAGISLATDGLLSGTPTAPDGITYFTVRASDAGSGDTLDIACRMVIYPELSYSPGGGIQLTPVAYVGVPFNSALIPSGGKPPYKFTTGSSLPAGLTMSKTGVVSGIPETVTITVFSHFLTDAINKAHDLSTLHLNSIVVLSPQREIQPQKNSSDVGDPGPTNINIVEGANITITASNDGETATYEIAAAGGGGSGVETVNGIGPDSSGNVPLYTDTGITFVGGAKAGVAIDPTLIGAECSSISTGEYAYPAGGTDWQLWVYPTPASGTFELDVRKKAFANSVPGSGDSICASAKPSLAGDGLTLTATGDLSTWTDSPIARGSQVTVVPTVNTAGVTWWAFYMPARRDF